jgi:transposase-like protein
LSQHFLLSPEARTLSLAGIMRMSDEEAHARFVAIRFAANRGEPFCPHCGVIKVYQLAETPIRWKCSGCRRKFSVTSGTLLHSRKPSTRSGSKVPSPAQEIAAQQCATKDLIPNMTSRRGRISYAGSR